MLFISIQRASLINCSMDGYSPLDNVLTSPQVSELLRAAGDSGGG